MENKNLDSNKQRNKYFFAKHKEQLAEETEKYDAYQESTKIDDNSHKCLHNKNLRMVGRELRCSCGAAWTGTAMELEKIYKLLKSRTAT